MHKLNFNIFTDKILDGTKKQTIRQPRKNPIKPGDRLALYAETQKLGEAVCSEVVPVTMFKRTPYRILSFYTPMRLDMGWEEIEKISWADGFSTPYELCEFFIDTYKLKLGDSKNFVIIKWEDFVSE